MKEHLPRVRRQGLLSLSAVEGLGGVGHPTASVGSGFFIGEEVGWDRRFGAWSALTTYRIGSLRGQQHSSPMHEVAPALSVPSMCCL